MRGKPKDRKKDGIYRALKRGPSTFMRRKVERVADELQHPPLATDPGKTKLLVTRGAVVADWRTTATALRVQGQLPLAREVEDYIRRMPAVATEKELLAKGLIAQVAAQRSRVRSSEIEHSVGDRAR